MTQDRAEKIAEDLAAMHCEYHDRKSKCGLREDILAVLLAYGDQARKEGYEQSKKDLLKTCPDKALSIMMDLKYKEGAEAMREKAKKVADELSWQGWGDDNCTKISEAIEALEL